MTRSPKSVISDQRLVVKAELDLLHSCKKRYIWSLPELKIPVLEFLKNEAIWKTSYLDRDMRIGRGATGNLFVFRKSDLDI
ncbi:MAG: PAP/fibrillin family protein [Hydrococcus sp. Prado102]|nr:PAP/fibrillin family protein [Hydrococcus sp. Prado102]